VCCIDLATIDGDFPSPLMPVILGHEVAGEVYAVGSGVKDLRIGDRVVLS